MVKTGRRAIALTELLVRGGLRPARTRPSPPRIESLPDELAGELSKLFETLGGREAQAPPRPGSWDLAFDNDLVIELDEELHFNRYRALTLEPEWASALPWRTAYLRFCAQREHQCLAAGGWGKRWTNPSCEAMFGPAGPAGKLGDQGAARWKQRAFYDAIKDAFASTHPDIRLARIATHDEVAGVEIGAALEGRAALDVERLVGFVGVRAS